VAENKGIPSEMTAEFVGEFKENIKARKVVQFRDVDADLLTLWMDRSGFDQGVRFPGAEMSAG
jgi:hypothetical protein